MTQLEKAMTGLVVIIIEDIESCFPVERFFIEKVVK